MEDLETQKKLIKKNEFKIYEDLEELTHYINLMKQEKERIAQETNSIYDQQIGEKMMEVIHSLEEKHLAKERAYNDKIQMLEHQINECKTKYEQLSDTYAVMKASTRF